MTADKTYFLSDIHLGASYIANPREHESMIVSWLRYIRTDCRRLFLVGDILDYWWEYKQVVPKGYVRFFGELASMSDSGIEITWLIGNHDIWIFDYLPNELGVRVVDGTITTCINGKNFFISHGDGLGKMDNSFRFIRSLFRNRICQKLYATLHPGLTIPLAHRWSSSSRRNKYPSQPDYESMELRPLRDWAENFVTVHHDIDYIIVGHYHIIEHRKIGPNTELVILGDWIDKFSYAVFDGKQLTLRKYN